MAIRPITIFPDPVLTTETKPVGEMNDEVKQLIEDMKETMYFGDGIGLAATQVGVSLRVMVMDVPDEEGKSNLIALMNPEILEREGEVMSEEGCLSFPGINITVKRSERVKVKALDEEGQPVEIEADGLAGICLQHEIDHLDGVVFVDHLGPLKRKITLKEYRKLREAAEAEA